ncbi:hypothetical protein GX563_05360 [Candidatus Bathyarchaeota archaeon]|nr:hypothetical protein [Candidatus Bathyarchaeota archaeon]
MKRIIAFILLLAFTLSAIVPFVSLSGASAQTGYSITQVDHNIQVMYSGNVAVLDTIHVSGTVTDGFTIAVPYAFSTGVLKVIAYDDSHTFTVNQGGIQLGDQTGFYAVQINFNGYTPSRFTVAFILSNGVTIDQGNGNFLIAFPAYPSLDQTVGAVNVQVTTPQTPASISIGKDDGNVTSTSYTASNLAAYTYSVAQANIKVTAGTIVSSMIPTLDRQINIDATGTVNAVETYQIINNASTAIGAYTLTLPAAAINIDVRDTHGTALSAITSSGSNMQLVNATLQSYLSSGQATTLTVHYSLPGAILQNDQYEMKDFQLFANYQYVIAEAKAAFNLPQGATITSPEASQLDSSSTLTRGAYQDTLTVTADQVSSVDFLAPQANTIELAYQYNPVWVSFTPTLVAIAAAIIAVAAIVIYRNRKPKETRYTRTVKSPPQKSAAKKNVAEVVKGEQITAEHIRDFIDAYEDKKQLTAELHAIDTKAQKGKIPRRQYKVQREALENKIKAIDRTIKRNKAVFRGAAGTYPELMNQLDLAEADQAEAEESIRNLEARQSKGQISIESYKRNIADAQKTRDKAEASINGILLRLREKIR